MFKFIIILIVSFSSIYSNIYIDSVNVLNYPKIEANYYKLNDGDLVESDVFLFEETDQRVINQFTKISGEKKRFNGYFMVDISSSMQRNRNQVNHIISNIINGLSEVDSLGIVSFNQNCFINVNKTNDISRLNIALSLLSYFGSSNLNELFFNSPISINKIFNEGEDFILITDKQSAGDYSRIKEFFKDNNISLHIIYLTNNENIIYQNMLNGYFLRGNQFNSDYTLLSKYLDNRLRNEDYFRISWETTRCKENVIGNIVQSPDYIYDFSYSLSEVLEKVLDIIPNSFNQINYTINNQITIDINITSLNQDIEVKSITSSNSEFQVISDIKKINKGQTSKFQVAILPTELKYYFTNINILTDCDNNIVPIEIGRYQYFDKDVTLNVKNGTDFFRNDIVEFEIIGLSPSDTISLDYRQNNQWTNIVSNFNNIKYNWELSNVALGNMDFKISFKDIDFKRFNQKEIATGNRNANLMKLSYDSKLVAIINSDNRLSVIDIEEGIDKGNYADNLLSFNMLAWSFNNGQIATVRNSNNTPIIFSLKSEAPIELAPINQNASAICWNNLSNQLFIGLANGNINIYNNLGDNQSETKVLSTSGSQIEFLKFNPKENIIVYANSQGLIEAVNTLNDNKISVISTNEKILNLTWNSQGDSLFISDSKNIYIYRLSFTQGEFRFTQVKQTLVPYPYTYAEYDFKNTLIYLKNNRNIKILDINMNFLYEFNIDAQTNGVFDLKDNILVTNELSNRIYIRELDKYEDVNFKNDIIFTNKINIIEKNLNLRNLNFGSLCYQIPLDTNITNLTLNTNRKAITFDSVSITNNNDKRITINLNSNLLNQNQQLNLNILVNTIELGQFSHKITLHSKNDKFVFDLVYNVVFDKIEKTTTYFDLGKINYKSGENFDIEILNNLSDEAVKILKINQINFNENIEYDLRDSIIKANSKFNLGINFAGEELGQQLLNIQVYAENACSPFDFIIFGEVVSPDILVPFGHNLDTVVCSSDSYKQLIISNIGDGNLNIEEIFTIQNNFNISINSNVIQPNQDLIINFEFNREETGYFEDTLYLKTNHIFGKGNEFIVLINGYKYKSELELQSRYNFENPEKNIELFGEFIVKNVGNSIESIIFSSIENEGFFEIYEIVETILNEDEETLVKVKFKGGNENILYEERFEVLNSCNQSYIITLSVDFRDVKPFLSSINFIDYGEFYCLPQFADTTLLIQNIGGADLLIENIEIKGKDNSNFELLNWDKRPITIPRNEFFELKVRYKPNIMQEDNAFIEIKSNIEANNGISLIILLGIFKNTNLSFDKSVISFDNVESNVTHTTLIKISNNGNIVEDLRYSIDNPIFQISGISKTPLPLLDEVIVSIDFLGGQPDAIFNGNLNIVAECNTYTIPVNAIVRGTNYFELSSNNISAKTGDIIEIPIYFRNPEELILNTPFVLETELVVDKNIIIPIENESYLDEDKRIIPLSYNVNNLNDKILENVKIKVTLGNKNNSEITFRNSRIRDNSLYFIEVSTNFLMIDNICIEGGQRFVEGADSFYISIPYPNPADEFIEIGYGLIEDTYTTLSIKDLFGRDVIKLIDNKVMAHSNTIKVPLNNLAIGQYFIHLSTPNNQFTRIFTIIR